MSYKKLSGKEFEDMAAKVFLQRENIKLSRNFKLEIGISQTKKHNFDLGSATEKVLIECKCHSWTKSGNNPSAKMSIWNEAMFYFMLAPEDYRKILFVRNQINPRDNKSLADYYIKTHPNFIPNDVEIWEYDDEKDLLRVCEIERNVS